MDSIELLCLPGVWCSKLVLKCHAVSSRYVGVASNMTLKDIQQMLNQWDVRNDDQEEPWSFAVEGNRDASNLMLSCWNIAQPKIPVDYYTQNPQCNKQLNTLGMSGNMSPDAIQIVPVINRSHITTITYVQRIAEALCQNGPPNFVLYPAQLFQIVWVLTAPQNQTDVWL